MFYIVGVAHPAQSRQKGVPLSSAQRQFRDCISEAIARVKPALIAEELSQCALDKLSKKHGGQEESIAKGVRGPDLEHRFCDPGDGERARIGYVECSDLMRQFDMNSEERLSDVEVSDRAFAVEVAKYWPLREQYWLDQLSDVLDKDVIFVCGDSHVESFTALLVERSIDFSVVARRVGATRSDDDWWNRVKSYLASHPELGE